MYLQSDRYLKFDIACTKRAFYVACNSIFMHGFGINEIALLSLQETYCLCVLMYAIPALNLTAKQLDELNLCWNSVIGLRNVFTVWPP